MSKRYFPIQTETSCRLKWSWSTLYLNDGTTASCHRASRSILGESLSGFHNTELKVQARQQMLAGTWPKGGCEYCSNIEQAGGISDRQFQNQVPDSYPQELDQDPTATVVDPVVLEVFFSNTCNLKCLYCTAKLSSAIQAENTRFGGAVINSQDHQYQDNRYQELVPQFWNWFEPNAHKLKRLQVLGGEPFLQQDVSKLYDYFETHACPDLEFNLVTNLIVPTKLLRTHLDRLASLLQQRKLKRVDLLASVDSWGPGQEYVRHGFERQHFETNLKLIQEFGVFRLGLLSTVNALSIHEMPALCDKYLEWNQTQSLHWYMHLVIPEGTSLLDPLAFDYCCFSSSLDQVAAKLPCVTWDQKRTVEVFEGIQHKLKQQCVNKPHHDMINYLTQIDTRRNTNWKETFPWLEKETNNVV